MARQQKKDKSNLDVPSKPTPKSLEERIEALDKQMEEALEKGEFEEAKRLAEEQERFLEDLMFLE